MRVAWVDAAHGAAGDMLLGALLDAGASLQVVRAAVEAVAPEPVEVGLAPTRRHGLRAARASVEVADSTTHRGLADVLALVRGGGDSGVPGLLDRDYVGGYALALAVVWAGVAALVAVRAARARRRHDHSASPR